MNVCYLKLSCCFSEKESPLNSFSPFLFREAENNLFLFLFFSFHFIMQHCFDYCWSPSLIKALDYSNTETLLISVLQKREITFWMWNLLWNALKDFQSVISHKGWLVNFVNLICLQCHHEENLNAALCHYLLHMSHSPSISRLFRIRTCMQSLRCHWWHQYTDALSLYFMC